MLTASSLRLVFLALVCTQLQVRVLADTCAGKEEQLAACTQRLEGAMDASWCSEMETYIRCLQDVKVSCHDDAAMQAVDFNEQEFTIRCFRDVSSVVCNYDALFYSYAPICHSIITERPDYMPLVDLCANTRQYLNCLQTANAHCENAEANLGMGISVTQTGLTNQCSEEALQYAADNNILQRRNVEDPWVLG